MGGRAWIIISVDKPRRISDRSTVQDAVAIIIDVSSIEFQIQPLKERCTWPLETHYVKDETNQVNEKLFTLSPIHSTDVLRVLGF